MQGISAPALVATVLRVGIGHGTATIFLGLLMLGEALFGSSGEVMKLAFTHFGQSFILRIEFVGFVLGDSRRTAESFACGRH